MATTYHTLTGKIEWAKSLFELDAPGGGIPPRYVVNFYPDDREALKKTGSQLQYDKKTNSYIRPRREPTKETRDGKVLEFGAPKVLNADGSDYTGGPRSIGNGTTAEVTIAVYEAGRFKGTRLEKVRILDLIEYNPENKIETEQPGPATSIASAEATKAVKPRLPF